MSKTIKALAINSMAEALDRITYAYETRVDTLHTQVLSWGSPDATPDVFLLENTDPIMREIQAAAAAKWALARMIRTRPELLPPAGMKYPVQFTGLLITLGDADTLEHLSSAVADLRYAIKDSAWNMNVIPADVVEFDTKDELGSVDDLGEVSAGPAGDL